MGTLAAATWPEITLLRDGLMATRTEESLEAVAQKFTTMLSTTFSSVVLARVFLLLPQKRLDADAQAFLARKYPNEARLTPETPVLALLGTSGRQVGWNQRLGSEGHLAIPLLDREFVQGIPMIAKLLGDLEANLSNLGSGLPIASRHLLGGNNATFFVPDARAMVDTQGRAVISASPFVTEYGVRAVFGMGGAYLDGTLAIAVVFTDELVERLTVDRFPSLISNFKMATNALLLAGRIFSKA